MRGPFICDANDAMRLNKFISDSGLCSRREADEMIAAGRVTVNGAAAEMGHELEGGERIEVDGNPVKPRGASGGRKTVYIALYKPVGITCTTEREVEGNIVDFVDHAERIFPIGRLDKDSEGLILLTNDGDVVNPILRAENRHEKEYLVGVNNAVTPEFLTGMARGVQITPREVTQPCKVYKLGRFGFRIVLTQGLNRQIRRMAQAYGYRVKELRRVRVMNVQLGHLKPGQWRNLTPVEVAGLMKHCAMAAKPVAATKPRKPVIAKPKKVPVVVATMREGLGKRVPVASQDRGLYKAVPKARREESRTRPVRQEMDSTPVRRGRGEVDAPAGRGRSKVEAPVGRSGRRSGPQKAPRGRSR
jgi:23S rRNA pseudouridine2604 synthase